MATNVMREVDAAVYALACKAMEEYRKLPVGRATLYYRPTTADADGELLVKLMDDDVDLGWETAMQISCGDPYEVIQRKMIASMARLPILPRSVIYR